MSKEVLPLEEVSINELFNSAERAWFEVPIYQRNYAWEREEISALVQDIYDSFLKDKISPCVYYIGTLVTYHLGERHFEVIDGQQRLTTIRLILGVLEKKPKNDLTYRARRKSDLTIAHIPDFKIDDPDVGIVNGYKYAKESLSGHSQAELAGFTEYFLNKVHIIHYRVPKDIDLNHYFEIMNSRGEQLEKHEIIKARLLSYLNEQREHAIFSKIWESCSNMGVYIQQTYPEPAAVFGPSLTDFALQSFQMLPTINENTEERQTIEDLLSLTDGQADEEVPLKAERMDSFQPIIDFPNFLLIVLKLTRLSEPGFSVDEFLLDDKELIKEFGKVKIDASFVRRFGFILLKAKFLLDNYLVHHSNEDDTIENNPWKLEKRQIDSDRKKGYLKNLFDDLDKQMRAVHLLSMFEVSFTARQRKNYLFYCLQYLFTHDTSDVNGYLDFLEDLADKYFSDVYLVPGNLNAINTPRPGSFDAAMIRNGTLDSQAHRPATPESFVKVYGDGTEKSRGIPLFVFNYIDYKLWEKYSVELRGEASKKGSKKRNEFFDSLGCSDFDLKVFDQFYFSRTRRSLEHYYPQAMATGENGRLNANQINCLGNFAMIGSDVNSAGSDWSPKAKLIRYLDSSGKIKQVSVASLKFMIMMQMCKDNQDIRKDGQEWTFEDIQAHQKHILDLLFSGSSEPVMEESMDKKETPDPGYSMYTAADPGNATSKYVNCYVLLGERINVDSFAAMVRSVAQKLYEYDSSVIEQMAETLEVFPTWANPVFAYNEAALRNPVKLSRDSDIYIATGFSAYDCICFIKALLKKYDLDLENAFVYSAKPSPGKERELRRIEIEKKWCETQREAGMLGFDAQNCSGKFVRFTTPYLDSLLPKSLDKLSPWKTPNYYFYEIGNRRDEVYFQLCAYCQNLTNDMREAFSHLARALDLGEIHRGYLLYYKSAPMIINDDDTEEDVIEQLNKILAEVQAFEKKIADRW